MLYAVTGARSVLPIARLLLDAGANPTDGESVFHAAEHFHEDALELLLAAGADLNATGEWGNTPLYFLLRWHDVERGPSRRRRSAGGATALHFAALHGDAESIALLLGAGADVNIRDGEHSSTPLGWACRGADLARTAGGDDEGCARRLLAAGARPRDDEHVPRDEAVRAALATPGSE